MQRSGMPFFPQERANKTGGTKQPFLKAQAAVYDQTSVSTSSPATITEDLYPDVDAHALSSLHSQCLKFSPFHW